MPTTITAQSGAVIKQQTRIAVIGCPKPAAKPAVKITKTKARGSTLLVTVRTTASGTVKLSGAGLRLTGRKALTAGTHRLSIPITTTADARSANHTRTTLRATLTAGGRRLSSTTHVRL
jgi:hypothetical protein